MPTATIEDAAMLSPADIREIPPAPRPQGRVRSPFCRAAGLGLAALARLLAGASVRWIASQPDTCQRIYFANHTSHLDALVIWASLPQGVREVTRPVAAKDYWDRGFVRRWLAQEVFDAILIDRTDIKVHQSPVDLMLREAGTTCSLIVFPEGSRSVSGEVGEFKSGLYYLAKKRPELELIPVSTSTISTGFCPGASSSRCPSSPASASGRPSGSSGARRSSTSCPGPAAP